VDLEQLVDDYLAAWAALDDGTRTAALERCWAEDGVYTDPTWVASGRKDFAEHLAGFHERLPGTRFVRGPVDGYGPNLRFAWRLLREDGSEALRGTDIGRVDGDGRLASITGFFGELPDAPG